MHYQNLKFIFIVIFLCCFEKIGFGPVIRYIFKPPVNQNVCENIL